ncbi:MAG: bifunctional diaminohydroxyphosphoribosylaminopyrimidine deaminase/5-amino-6-(5-phosphoribosylamino)uracil reductase RibD [Desulfofustis sp.]|nr:bifunctional diaminohydroxyphosphoribosylaminopyrimidine deaminase/5-amino-6-(5-phosphoribosylamino)uracil reductase RibD [Desulfofustis sp.]
MRIALREARKGLGRTSPNPCVGAVIVKDGDIIARGYHKKAGAPHAEIEALKKVGGKARDATMYVTLEPCNHHGKTPPCSNAVAESGIKKVVIGMLDPNPLVNGSGAEFLSSKGIEIRYGLLEEQCRKLNRPFLTYIKEARPWVMLKAGLTLDGKITFRNNSGDAITGHDSLKWVHRMRDRCDALLVGSNTITVDNPFLTARIKGRRGENPIRIVLDTNLKIPSDANVVKQNDDRRTWVFCGSSAPSGKISELNENGVEVFQVAVGDAGRVDLGEVLRMLGSRQITSLLVEGGAEVHGSFLKAGLVDNITLFYAPYVAGDRGTGVIQGIQTDGGREDAIRLHNISHRRLGDDLMISGDVLYPDRKE